jgi:hypothetical protein
LAASSSAIVILVSILTLLKIKEITSVQLKYVNIIDLASVK